MQVHIEPAGFLLRSTELKGRTSVKGVTLWPQSYFSMTWLTSMYINRDISIPIEDDLCVVAEELPH